MSRMRCIGWVPFIFIKCIKMNEVELVKQTKEFKIGSIHAFSSYLVSAICKTLLNAESDAEY